MIREMIKNLRYLPNSFWDEYAFRNELLIDKISPEEKQEFTEKTHQCGKDLADEILSANPDMSPSLLANSLGLNVSYIDEPFSSEYVMFACFNEPNNVRILNDIIEKSKIIIRDNDLYELLSHVDIGEVLMAHEIYHYLEYTMPNLYTSQKLLTLWRLGKFKYKSKVLCLNEIGAMAFTQKFLDLPYSPYIFDLLFLYTQNKQMAKELYENIMDLATEKEIIN